MRVDLGVSLASAAMRRGGGATLPAGFARIVERGAPVVAQSHRIIENMGA